jgi:hypothetical protein
MRDVTPLGAAKAVGRETSKAVVRMVKDIMMANLHWEMLYIAHNG